MTFNKAFYDTLKWWAQIGIPGVAVLYSGISGIWGLPDVTQVVGSLAAVDTFLGLILAQSSRNYIQIAPGAPPPQGSILVDQTNPARPLAVMQFHEQDADKLERLLATSKNVTFEIVHAVPDAKPPVEPTIPPAA